MTEQTLIEGGAPVQDATDSLTRHFERCRREAIQRYRDARTGNIYLCRAIRNGARAQALHYSRMVRMMEGRA